MRALTLLLASCALASCLGAHVPELDAAGAQKLGAESTPLIVDLRSAAEFEGGHLPGAIPLELDEVDAYLSRAGVPRERALLFACAHGRLSQIAGGLARERGYARVFSLGAGMDRYVGATEKGAGPTIPAELRKPLFFEASWIEQFLDALTGTVIKTIYMTLTLVVVALLWRTRERGLVLVRHAMVLFFFGEAMCAVNFIFAAGLSDSIELFHGLGMAGMGMFLPWGLARLADDRVLRYEDPAATCAVQRFCGHCWKREQVSCGLQRLFLVLAPSLALTALLPLGSTLAPLKVGISIFGTSMIELISLPLQLIEFRIYPVLACALFGISFLLLFGGKRTFHWSQPFFFGGVGFMGFSFMRFLMFRAFRERIVWADIWEEATELVAVLLVLFALYVFRKQLGLFGFLERKAPPAEKSAQS